MFSFWREKNLIFSHFRFPLFYISFHAHCLLPPNIYVCACMCSPFRTYGCTCRNRSLVVVSCVFYVRFCRDMRRDDLSLSEEAAAATGSSRTISSFLLTNIGICYGGVDEWQRLFWSDGDLFLAYAAAHIKV